MNKPVILLNAPPNSGKDTIAAVLSERLGLPHKEFKGKLFELALSISGLQQWEWDEIYTRELKEKPSDRLWGMSPRAFMIDISERMIKPACGRAYFGEILGMQCGQGAVVSDSGFNTEAEALAEQVGGENVYCVQFTREGCSFDGDSRRFIDTPAVENYLLTNNDGTVEDIVREIITWLYTKQLGVEA